MPHMPKLLKKLSRKSFRSHHDSDHETDSEPPPSLPVTEYDSFSERSFSAPGFHRFHSEAGSANHTPSSSLDWPHGDITRSASTGDLLGRRRRNTDSEKPHARSLSVANVNRSPLPRARTTSYGGNRNSRTASVFSPSQLGSPPALITGTGLSESPRSLEYRAAPDDEFSRNLAGAWKSASTDPKVSKFDKALQFVENGVIQAQANQGQATMLQTGITMGLEAVGAMEAIEHGLNTFMEAVPQLMAALDEVAKLHPFVGVAVMAFKAVWALEMKRRSNDKMILSLHMEMKDMMGVLTQLKSIKDPEEVAPDGSTIRGRMQGILQSTADDIKSCANACDTYTKKKLIVKILKSSIWEGKLVKFVGIFTKRRSEFEFALSIHTALGVDAANRALTVVDKTTQEMNAKMDMMMKMFQQFVAPEQKEMARLVEQKGGIQACQENDKILKELYDLESKSSPTAPSNSGSSKSAATSGMTSGLEELKDELATDPDAAMEKNLTVFTRKFEVQKRQIIDELTKVVERQGDRVISALTSGPHDKIIDPDVHKIWKEMGWRGSVKSRYFVMALRDYIKKARNTPLLCPAVSTIQVGRLGISLFQDYRASARLSMTMQAGKFVTVAEANTFTTSRPLDWSLTHWCAFWAVGWHQSMARYSNKIQELVAKMFALRSHVLPANRSPVNRYLDSIYHGVSTLHSGLNSCYINESLQERFQSYVDAEEARLRGNLEAVSYDIDALNTVPLITGQGRIERFLLPLIFLLLERDFEILRIGQKKVLHPDELWDSADSVGWALAAARERVDLLESSFKQQKVDMKQQFKTFAHGLFQYMHDPSGLWDPKLVLAQDEAEYPYDDSLESQDVDVTKILNYPLGMEKLDFEAYNAVTIRPKKATTRPSPTLKALLGNWNGFTYATASSAVPTSGMISMDLSATGSLTFAASSRSNMTDFTISGNCSGEGADLADFTFRQSFPARFSPVYFSGSFNGATQSLSGTWGEESDTRTHKGVFIFKRSVPECMCFFPAPVILEANKPRALWFFATSAVLYGIRRGTWSWSFFKQRAESRRRFIELYIRSTRFGRPLNRTEEDELGLIKKSFTTADSRFFHSIAENKIRVTTSHDVRCDACKGTIGGTRVTCLTCRLEGTFDTVDFCDNPSCMSAKVVPTGLTRLHLPTHDILKVRRVVHIRQFGKTYRQAHQALKRAREYFPNEDDSEAIERVVRKAPNCAICKLAVMQPCWFCVQCEDSFICNTCETRRLGFTGHNIDSHDLVRCQPLAEGEVMLEERLADLERRFERHEEHMDDQLKNLRSNIDERMSRVDSRLLEMEKLLLRLVSALPSVER
ncbi:hypothetical protein C8J57DRAFT_1591283 [Mycena rebaudengoi]|nr:hypothetical protein C8J57DRAFT_1591283 [Mycena rebaudengoi]